MTVEEITCTECHNDTSIITGKKAAWEESLHGSGVAFIEEGPRNTCAGCHSGATFSTMIAAGQNFTQVEEGDANPTHQDCRTCHQIHTTYTSKDWALETTEPVTQVVSGLTFDTPGDTFRLEANFANIGSLKPRARVTMAGVTVGRVAAIELDTDWYDARVILELDAELEGRLSQDTTAAILTSGLLGEQYVGLSVGGDPETLADGDTIRDTQSAVVLEELIQQFVSNMVSD